MLPNAVLLDFKREAGPVTPPILTPRLAGPDGTKQLLRRPTEVITRMRLLLIVLPRALAKLPDHGIYPIITGIALKQPRPRHLVHEGIEEPWFTGVDSRTRGPQFETF